MFQRYKEKQKYDIQYLYVGIIRKLKAKEFDKNGSLVNMQSDYDAKFSIFLDNGYREVTKLSNDLTFQRVHYLSEIQDINIGEFFVNGRGLIKLTTFFYDCIDIFYDKKIIKNGKIALKHIKMLEKIINENSDKFFKDYEKEAKE